MRPRSSPRAGGARRSPLGARTCPSSTFWRIGSSCRSTRVGRVRATASSSASSSSSSTLARRGRPDGTSVERGRQCLPVPARLQGRPRDDAELLQQKVASEVAAPTKPAAVAEDDPVGAHRRHRSGRPCRGRAVLRRARGCAIFGWTRGYCPVLADGASPPRRRDGAADAPAAARPRRRPLRPAPPNRRLPPDGEPEDGARVGPYVQPPRRSPEPSIPAITTAAPSATRQHDRRACRAPAHDRRMGHIRDGEPARMRRAVTSASQPLPLIDGGNADGATGAVAARPRQNVVRPRPRCGVASRVVQGLRSSVGVGLQDPGALSATPSARRAVPE